MIGVQEEILKIHSLNLLDRLLKDQTTNGNIMRAPEIYSGFGEAYGKDREVKPELITESNFGAIKSRTKKILSSSLNALKSALRFLLQVGFTNE